MSGQTKHTPGPWKFDGHYFGDGLTACGGRNVAEIMEADTPEETEANARLIATAPDGLALAEMVLAGATIETPADLIVAAEKLIAKAVGGAE